MSKKTETENETEAEREVSSFVTSVVLLCGEEPSSHPLQASMKISLVTAVLARLSVSRFSQYSNDATNSTNIAGDGGSSGLVFTAEQQDAFTRYQMMCNKIRRHLRLPHLPVLTLSPRLLLLGPDQYFAIYHRVCQTQADKLLTDELVSNETSSSAVKKKKKTLKKKRKEKVRHNSTLETFEVSEDPLNIQGSGETQPQTLDQLLCMRLEANTEASMETDSTMAVSEEWRQVTRHTKTQQQQQQKIKIQQQQEEKKIKKQYKNDEACKEVLMESNGALAKTTDEETIGEYVLSPFPSLGLTDVRNCNDDLDNNSCFIIGKESSSESKALADGNEGSRVYSGGIVDVGDAKNVDNNFETKQVGRYVTINEIESNLIAVLSKPHLCHTSSMSNTGVKRSGSSSAACVCGLSVADTMSTIRQNFVAQQQQLLPTSSPHSSAHDAPLSAAATLAYCSQVLESLVTQHELCLQHLHNQHTSDTCKLRETHDQAIHTGNLRLFIANNTLSTERENRNKLVEDAVAEFIKSM